MSWLVIALIAYLLFAVAQLTDKFIIIKYRPSPLVYTFFVSFVGIAVLIFLPWAFFLPPIEKIIFNLITGALYSVAIFFLYRALVKGEASRIITLIGTISPLIVFTLSYTFFQEKLTEREILAFFILVLGGLLISWKKTYQKHALQTYLSALISAIFFSIFYVLLKQVYLNQPFFSGLIWTRLGAFIIVLPILFFPKTRINLWQNLKSKGVKMSRVFVFGQTAGALGFVILNYAYALASASLINALQGFQYTSLFILVLIFAPRFSQLKEKLTKPIIIQKILAILLVGIGLFLLAY